MSRASIARHSACVLCAVGDRAGITGLVQKKRLLLFESACTPIGAALQALIQGYHAASESVAARYTVSACERQREKERRNVGQRD